MSNPPAKRRFIGPVAAIVTLLALTSTAFAAGESTSPGIQERINEVFDTWLVTPIAKVFFADVIFWSDQYTVPLAVLWLVLGAVFFTIFLGGINFTGMKHAIALVRGKYDNPDDVGEVSHFQALTAALSATVGLGNIAGVAIAISVGGPGATFWMIVAGCLGMASKFTECTLGQVYRRVGPDGSVMGGGMMYLSEGLKERGLANLGKVLAVIFAILCIGGSLAGGNAFQVNQSMGALSEKVVFLQEPSNRWIYGAIMTILVGIVIIGGIKRIASTAERIVPLMCGIYIVACLYILFLNAAAIPQAFGAILEGAVSPKAGLGGLMGVLVAGFQRAAFSNEAGTGSAAIAHSAAKTEHPIQEGYVALLEPFIDTVVVCTMTALVIVITGAWDAPEYESIRAAREGAVLTSRAFGDQITWFPWLLSGAVVLFAFSTMISWSYYGERCWTWLFGDNSTLYYRLLFLVFVMLGSVITATKVLDFGDLMILGMAFPNILGLFILAPKVRGCLDDYREKLKTGAIKAHK